MVLGFGAVTIDDIIYVDRPLSAGKGKVTRRITDHGGNVATALVAVARLGGRAGFIGWLSDGTLDDPSAGELERRGGRHVAGAAAGRCPGDPLGHHRRARRRAVHRLRRRRCRTGPRETLADDALARGRVLLIDGYATHAHAVVARARALGLAVVADIEWTIGPATDALMALADHLVLPIGFARAYTGESDVAAMLAGSGRTTGPRWC